MILSNLKFKSKIYTIIFLLITTFSISIFISGWSIKNIANNIEKLKNENENLQLIIILLADIEKLKRFIFEYTLDGNEITKKHILDIFSNIKQKESKLISDNEKINFYYKKLIENIKKYIANFEIAQEHIPLNISLKKKLRLDAENIENQIDKLKLKETNSDRIIKLMLLKKSLLEIEKGVFRYFETDEREYIEYAKKKLKITNSLLEEIKIDIPSKFNKSIEEITKQLKNFNLTFYKTIEHYRTYSMLTKVVMAGDTYEINHYAQNLKNLTLKRVNDINSEIDSYMLKSDKLSKITAIFYIFLIIFSFWLIIKIAIKPLRLLTLMFEKLSSGEDNVQIPQYKHNDEIGKLINSANSFQEKNRQTKLLLKETQDYKENLEIKVEKEIAKRREREKALIQQSKLASMGEMIGAIAHQWRQPLNVLSIRIQKLKYNYLKDEIDEEFLEKFIDKNKITIEFMSKTIDDFRNFFRIDKQKSEFSIKETIDEVLSIQSAQLENHNIKVNVEYEDFILSGFKTEFQQVIINIISNSKDVFLSKEIKEPKIEIKINDRKITLEDNGGGIPQNIIDRIFEPYFTTKEQGEGTGIGLYMSKMIIEDNMNGKMYTKNTLFGALFILDFS